MEIVDKIRDVSRSVAAKSGEFAESGKLTFNIKKKEKEIRSLERKIGMLVYDSYLKGLPFDEEIMSECRKIDEVCQEVARLEMEKEKLGLDNVDVEVVDTGTPEDEEFVLSAEDEEILKEL